MNSECRIVQWRDCVHEYSRHKFCIITGEICYFLHILSPAEVWFTYLFIYWCYPERILGKVFNCICMGTVLMNAWDQLNSLPLYVMCMSRDTSFVEGTCCSKAFYFSYIYRWLLPSFGMLVRFMNCPYRLIFHLFQSLIKVVDFHEFKKIFKKSIKNEL